MENSFTRILRATLKSMTLRIIVLWLSHELPLLCICLLSKYYGISNRSVRRKTKVTRIIKEINNIE